MTIRRRPTTLGMFARALARAGGMLRYRFDVYATLHQEARR